MAGTRPRPKDSLFDVVREGPVYPLATLSGDSGSAVTWGSRATRKLSCCRRSTPSRNGLAEVLWPGGRAQNTGLPPAVALSGPRTTKVERLRTHPGPECPVSTRQDATARSRSSSAIVHFFRHRDLLSTPTRTKLVPGNSRNKRRRCPPGPNSTSETESHGEGVLPRPPLRHRSAPASRAQDNALAGCRTEQLLLDTWKTSAWWKRWFMAIRARNSTQDRSRLPQGFTATLEASSAFLGSAKVMVRLESCE